MSTKTCDDLGRNMKTFRLNAESFETIKRAIIGQVGMISLPPPVSVVPQKTYSRSTCLRMSMMNESTFLRQDRKEKSNFVSNDTRRQFIKSPCEQKQFNDDSTIQANMYVCETGRFIENETLRIFCRNCCVCCRFDVVDGNHKDQRIAQIKRHLLNTSSSTLSTISTFSPFLQINDVKLFKPVVPKDAANENKNAIALIREKRNNQLLFPTKEEEGEFTIETKHFSRNDNHLVPSLDEMIVESDEELSINKNNNLNIRNNIRGSKSDLSDHIQQQQQQRQQQQNNSNNINAENEGGGEFMELNTDEFQALISQSNINESEFDQIYRDIDEIIRNDFPHLHANASMNYNFGFFPNCVLPTTSDSQINTITTTTTAAATAASATTTTTTTTTETLPKTTEQKCITTRRSNRAINKQRKKYSNNNNTSNAMNNVLIYASESDDIRNDLKASRTQSRNIRGNTNRNKSYTKNQKRVKRCDEDEVDDDDDDVVVDDKTPRRSMKSKGSSYKNSSLLAKRRKRNENQNNNNNHNAEIPENKLQKRFFARLANETDDTILAFVEYAGKNGISRAKALFNI